MAGEIHEDSAIFGAVRRPAGLRQDHITDTPHLRWVGRETKTVKHALPAAIPRPVEPQPGDYQQVLQVNREVSILACRVDRPGLDAVRGEMGPGHPCADSLAPPRGMESRLRSTAVGVPGASSNMFTRTAPLVGHTESEGWRCRSQSLHTTRNKVKESFGDVADIYACVPGHHAISQFPLPNLHLCCFCS